MFIFALFLLAIVVAAYGIALYDALVEAKLRVEQAWSGIDVLPRQRHHQVPRLIDMVQEHGGADGVRLE